ncbi:MAG: hypothetical protein KDE54_38985 [Caldilineaceae bacterium]|nr:hypothetical protein [Caldilineaceae bacterium]
MDNNATLRAKVATLSAENRKLRRVAKYSRTDALLERVRVDAQQLLVWRFSGLSISRRACQEMGMTQRRWSWARALLQHARIHDDQDVTADDFDGALAALESSAKHLERAGLETLRMRLPKFVLLANVTANAVANEMAHPVANNHVQKLATSRDGTHGRGVVSGGMQRNRRQEIEQRHMEVNR